MSDPTPSPGVDQRTGAEGETLPPSGVSTEREERAARAEEARARMKEAPGSSTARVRRYREKKKNAKSAPDPVDAGEITEAEKREAAGVFALLYDTALVPISKGRLSPLQPEQEERAGEALAPLIRKYAPFLGEWRHEITAGIVIFSIVRSNMTSETAEPAE